MSPRKKDDPPQNAPQRPQTGKRRPPAPGPDPEGAAWLCLLATMGRVTAALVETAHGNGTRFTALSLADQEFARLRFFVDELARAKGWWALPEVGGQVEPGRVIAPGSRWRRIGHAGEVETCAGCQAMTREGWKCEAGPEQGTAYCPPCWAQTPEGR